MPHQFKIIASKYCYGTLSCCGKPGNEHPVFFNIDLKRQLFSAVIKEKQRGGLLVGKEALEKDVVQVIESTRRLMELYYLSGDSESALRESRKLDQYINYYQLEISPKGEK